MTPLQIFIFVFRRLKFTMDLPKNKYTCFFPKTVESYIAIQIVFPNYNDMADNKAYLESVARSFGYFFGKEKKVRVNTISQSPTLTKAGKGVEGLKTFLSYAEKMSPLGNASAEDCANYIVSLFSDFTKKVSLQNLYHDGGFSNIGISEEMIKMFGD